MLSTMFGYNAATLCDGTNGNLNIAQGFYRVIKELGEKERPVFQALCEAYQQRKPLQVGGEKERELQRKNILDDNCALTADARDFLALTLRPKTSFLSWLFCSKGKSEFMIVSPFLKHEDKDPATPAKETRRCVIIDYLGPDSMCPRADVLRPL